MSWKKYFKPVNSVLPTSSGSDSNYVNSSKFSSWLPEIYQGPPDRLQRYNVYESMDMDHEVHAALDTISDFSTELDPTSDLPFKIKYNRTPDSNEAKILEKTLRQWCILNEFTRRGWGVFRSTLKYGDHFLIRDPETYKLHWCDPNKVSSVIVNESMGKKIESYNIKDLDLNLVDMVATNYNTPSGGHYGSTSLVFSPPLNTTQGYGTGTPTTGRSKDGKFSEHGEIPVKAEFVIHLTLSDGTGPSWPFGTSILEQAYKVYKQKELLEDSILIYRIHRAPERRVFFIDVGSMPPNKAQQYLERVKYEVQQKRIPSRSGGGSAVVDSSYNPMSALEDYFFSVTSEGRGSRVETLPSGDALGEINDLKYFNNKMLRALGVPSSYLPTGPEDGTSSFNDGRVGTAFIQEFRFSKVCERYQRQVIKPLDREFKLFLKFKGIDIDNSIFELKYPEPQSFSEYRQLELDAAKINVFASMAEVPYISKRFALKRYLGLTEEEVHENERLWKEENPSSKKVKMDSSPGGGLRSAGITPSDIGGIAPEGGFEEVDDIDAGIEDLDFGEDDIDSDVTGDDDDDEL